MYHFIQEALDHKTRLCPPCTNSVSEVIWRGKIVHVNIFECPFQKDKSNPQRQLFFYELNEDGEVVTARPRGVPLLKWVDLEEQKAISDEKTSKLAILIVLLCN